jgi:hypothetical protein
VATVIVASSRGEVTAAPPDFVAVHGLLEELRRSDPGLRVATTAGGLSRGGALSAEILVSLLLFMAADAGRHGYQTLLDDFWEQARAAGIELPAQAAPAAASFCNARKRLRPEVVRATLRLVTQRLLAARGPGRRFLAVDGSRLNVQRSEELWSRCRGNPGSGSPQVQISVLLELSDEVPLNVEVGPFDASEREQCLAHLECLRPGDVLVMDRGYPGFSLLWELLRRGIDVVARCASSSTFPAVERFLASGRKEAQIEIAASAAFKRSHPKEPRAPLRLRAVRIAAPDGTASVILTSLPRGEFPRNKIAKIYRRRWRIEELFKVLKSRHFGPGQFHAKSFAGVRQEIYAQALYVAVTRLLAAAASAPRTPDPAEPRAALHLKDALHAVSRCLVELLLGNDQRRLADLLLRLRGRMRLRTHSQRPGRLNPRRSFAPCPKWCSTGRRGRTVR